MIKALYKFILSRPHSRFIFSNRKDPDFIRSMWSQVYHGALKASEYFSPEEIFVIQKERTMELISRAKVFSSFYREYLKNIHTYDDFLSLPPLTKQDFRMALDRGSILNKSLEDFKVGRSTSGSSGVPFLFYHDRNMYTRRIAFYHRLLRWAGYRNGDVAVWIMREMHPEFGAIPFVCFGPEDIEKRKLELYKLLRRKYAILHAMTSHLVFLANLFEKDGEKFDFRGIISYAEPLHFEVRQYLEKKLRAPIFDNYGSQEILNPANECEVHNGFHINSEWTLVEVIGKDNRPLPPGQFGTVVMTSFDNEVMPFIRYKIGDVGYIMEGNCPCGRTLPRIKLAGREMNFFIHPNGKVGDFISLVLPILKMTPKVLQFQIIRHSRTDFTIRIVPTSEYNDECKQYIINGIREYLGPSSHITYETITEIPLGPGGKPKVFVNLENDLFAFIGIAKDPVS